MEKKIEGEIFHEIDEYGGQKICSHRFSRQRRQVWENDGVNSSKDWYDKKSNIENNN